MSTSRTLPVPMFKSARPSVIQHFIAATGEFVGTFLFLFFAFMWHQVCVANAPSTTSFGDPTSSTIMYISVGYGFSLLVVAWTFYRISGGLFNPSILFGMALVGQMDAIRAVILFPAELLGAICAAAVAQVLTPNPISTVETTLGHNVSISQGVFIEMFLTTILMFTVLMLAAEKSKVTFMAPLVIGLALFIAQVAGVGYTGASLNFARSLGPAVVAKSFPNYFWIYFVGPLLGAGIAAGFYNFLKVYDYEAANPGQDDAAEGESDGMDTAADSDATAAPSGQEHLGEAVNREKVNTSAV